MWHDTEQGEPNFDPPELPQWEDPSWVNWKIDDLGELNQHPMEVIDNMADKAHLGPIHGSTNMEYFENEFNDHVLVQRLAAGHRTMSEAQMINDTWYTGPGILLSKIEGDYPSMMMISNTPYTTLLSNLYVQNKPYFMFSGFPYYFKKKLILKSKIYFSLGNNFL